MKIPKYRRKRRSSENLEVSQKRRSSENLEVPEKAEKQRNPEVPEKVWKQESRNFVMVQSQAQIRRGKR